MIVVISQLVQLNFVLNVAQYEPINIDFPDYIACDNEYVLLEPIFQVVQVTFHIRGTAVLIQFQIIFYLTWTEGSSQIFSLEVIDDCTSESD